MKKISVSVAMATYNGEKYLLEQLESILPQLEDGDELVIGDDGSTDKTLEIISKVAEVDERVRVLQGDNLGVIRNFERIIKECNNELIFLSDQDDVWVANKAEVVKEHFLREEDLTLLMSDLVVVDKELEVIHPSYMKVKGCSTGILKNIVKNGYVGCALAFKKELKPIILPFPKVIPMHDQWIGILAEVVGRAKMIEDKLVLYRRYEDNATSLASHSSLLEKVTWRIKLCHCLIGRRFSRKGYKIEI